MCGVRVRDGHSCAYAKEQLNVAAQCGGRSSRLLALLQVLGGDLVTQYGEDCAYAWLRAFLQLGAQTCGHV